MSNRAPLPSREFRFAKNGTSYCLRAEIPDVRWPPPGERAVNITFGHHYPGRALGERTDEIVAHSPGAVHLSHDLGETWRTKKIAGFEDCAFEQAYRMRNGGYVLQQTGWNPAKMGLIGDAGRIIVLDKDLNAVATARNGVSHWHSIRAIGESGETLMYADYQINPGAGAEHDRTRIPSTVYRSRDAGRTWEPVFMTNQIRHFHLLMPDPARPGFWWLTSGDEPEESCIWTSEDDGDTWVDRSEEFMALMREAGITTQASLRTCDLLFTEKGMLWGTDDCIWTGASPQGSRVFSVEDRFAPSGLRDVNVIGPEIRSLFPLDDLVLVFGSAAPFKDFTQPTIWALDPREPNSGEIVITVENEKNKRSSLTYSCMSSAPTDDTFFTYRGTYDLFGYHPARIVKWTIERDR